MYIYDFLVLEELFAKIVGDIYRLATVAEWLCLARKVAALQGNDAVGKCVCLLL